MTIPTGPADPRPAGEPQDPTHPDPGRPVVPTPDEPPDSEQSPVPD